MLRYVAALAIALVTALSFLQPHECLPLSLPANSYTALPSVFDEECTVFEINASGADGLIVSLVINWYWKQACGVTAQAS